MNTSERTKRLSRLSDDTLFKLLEEREGERVEPEIEFSENSEYKKYVKQVERLQKREEEDLAKKKKAKRKKAKKAKAGKSLDPMTQLEKLEEKIAGSKSNDEKMLKQPTELFVDSSDDDMSGEEDVDDDDLTKQAREAMAKAQEVTQTQCIVQ